MEIKNTVTKFSYRIEAKPEGGFIARPSDPAMETLEAPTREALEQQIQAKVGAMIGQQFPELSAQAGGTTESTTTRFSYRIETKPEGGFIAHPSDPAMGVIEGVTKQEVEQKTQAKISAMLGQPLPNLFAKSDDVKVVVNRKLILKTVRRGSSVPPLDAKNELLQGGDPIQRTPLNPSDSGTVLRLIGGLLAVAALIYFWLHR